jgi:hypothetical protein
MVPEMIHRRSRRRSQRRSQRRSRRWSVDGLSTVKADEPRRRSIGGPRDGPGDGLSVFPEMLPETVRRRSRRRSKRRSQRRSRRRSVDGLSTVQAVDPLAGPLRLSTVPETGQETVLYSHRRFRDVPSAVIIHEASAPLFMVLLSSKSSFATRPSAKEENRNWDRRERFCADSFWSCWTQGAERRVVGRTDAKGDVNGGSDDEGKAAAKQEAARIR